MTRELTRFASPERLGTAELFQQFNAFLQYDCMGVLDMLPSLFFVLNRQRQVVFSSAEALKLLGKQNMSDLIGFRLGEIFKCEHAENSFSGCGTNEACRTCGAVAAILNSLSGDNDCKECRMMRKSGESLRAYDLRVTTRPLSFQDNLYSLVILEDISNEKWRDALERTFFHDILNVAGGIKGLVSILAEVVPKEFSREAEVLEDAFIRMVDEICTHRDLMAAEHNELDLKYIQFDALEVVEDIVRLFSMHQLAYGKTLRVGCPNNNGSIEGCLDIECDRTVLMRILGNMVKNALEAAAYGSTVTVDGVREKNCIRYTVHNLGEIPNDVQLQIFQRSFSTKGKGRGLGTYSMKLFTEQFLNGQVGFSSDSTDGTMFWVRIPLKKGDSCREAA